MKPGFKPMLAASVEDATLLTFPLLASPKFDGIRAVVGDGKLLSRNLKDIPNKHVQKMFGRIALNNMDGELIAGNPCSPTAFRDTSSAVMSHEGAPSVTFYVFDSFSDPRTEFVRRHASLKTRLKSLAFGMKVVVVPHVEVHNLEQLVELEAKWLAQGFEGVMLRSRNGEYKYGRSTLNQGWLMKLKQFADSEAVVLDVEEQMENTNEAKKDALGRTERSSKKAGLVGKGTMGAFVARDVHTNAVFKIGTGIDDATRAQLWADHTGKPVSYAAEVFDESEQKMTRKTLKAKPTGRPVVGRVRKYRYFPSGSKDKPRFPVDIGERDPIDC